MKVECQKRQYVQHNYKHKYGLFWDKQLGIKKTKNVLNPAPIYYNVVLLDTEALVEHTSY